MSPRRNVLIFHSGALGDFILTWPLALAMARMFPQNRLYYVAQGQKAALAERVLRVESADAEAGWHHLFVRSSEPPKLPEPAAGLLARAQLVFSFVAGPDGVWVDNVRRLVAPEAQVISLSQNAPMRIEQPGPADGAAPAVHPADYLVQQLQPFPALQQPVVAMLHSISQRGVGGSYAHRPGSGGPVVLHPGAGSPHKCWPVRHYLELAESLRAAGRSVRILLGEVELERWPAEQQRSFDAVAEVRRPGTLLELLEALRDAAAFVGNDSGPGHLAGILGIPCVSIFGPTDPARWRPLGPRVQAVQRMPLESLASSDILGLIPINQ